MNFEIIVRNLADGSYIVACPSLPNCEASGQSVEEAMEKVIDLIAERVSSNVKEQMKAMLKQIPKEIINKHTAQGNTISLQSVMTQIPISLN